MQKTKKNKYSIRTGLIFFLLWLLTASFMMSVSAATSDSGKTSDGKFTWSWQTNNTNSNAAGTFNSNSEEGTLTLTISANSSTYIEEKKNSCGSVTQARVDAESTTNNATITNDTGKTIRITSVTATIASCSVKVNDLLASGDIFTVSITAYPNNAEDNASRNSSGSVVITYRVVENVNVTYYGADGATYSYGGVSLTSPATSTTVPTAVGGSITLPATPTIHGGTFLGWRLSHDGSLHAANATVTIVNETSIYPVIKQDGMLAPFTVNGTAYEFWTDAARAAGSSGTIILNQDYTLLSTMTANGVSPAGSPFVSGTDGDVYLIIPQGVTLLIPYDDENTLITDNMDKHHSETSTVGTEYRRLTMVTGSNIVVNGAISVGSQACRQMVGQVGPYGAIAMDSGSNITINNGANLYAYGYIFYGEGGGGTVTVESGGSVYESASIRDYPGSATNTQGLYDGGVFPMRAYTLRNVEVSMTFKAGATEHAFYSLYGTAIGGAYPGYFLFIGSNNSAPFNLESGTTLTKAYSDGKTIVNVNGNMTVNPLNITLKISLIGSYPVSSQGTAGFPLPSGYDVTLTSGTMTLNDNFLMMEGSKITVAQGAAIDTNGKKIYIIDADDDDKGTVDATDVHGTHYTLVNSDAVLDVNGTIKVSGGGLYTSPKHAQIISSNGTGKIEFTNANIDQTSVTIRVGGVAGLSGGSKTLTMDSAYLLNANNTYVNTGAGDATNTYTYCSACLAWVCEYGSNGTVNFATNVELGNSLNMYFAFWDPRNPEKEFSDWDSYSVEISHWDAKGNPVNCHKSKDNEPTNCITLSHDLWSNTTVDGANACVAHYKGLSAKQMGDVIKVTLKDGSGTVVHEWSDSIQSYAMRLLQKYEDDEKKGTLRTLIVDMLNYGAECQKHFAEQAGVKIAAEDLVNAGLSDEQISWASKSVEWSKDMPSGSSSHLANLIVDGNIQFAISGASDQSTYTFMNHWHVEDPDNPENPERHERIGYLRPNEAGNYFYINKLYVADARQIISITVNGTTFTDSIESYCKRMIDDPNTTDTQKAVCTAFMKFSDSAYNYLHDVNKEGRV